MNQIDEIRELHKEIETQEGWNADTVLTCLADIPRLCDALEWAIKHLKNFEGHCNHHALRKIEEILEGK